MKQLTLWEPDPRIDSEITLIWERLDAASRTEVKTKLAMLMVKAVCHQHNALPSEKESTHEQ